MSNYYEILGISQSAGNADIKAAFRKLALEYHPDINPAGKERFTQILKAYETLSDPSLRAAYDLKLKYNASYQEESPKRRRGKSWNFDEKELRRRKYYDEHIKQYAKTHERATVSENKSNYNEFKYILFATPLAALLFLGIMKMAMPATSSLPEVQPLPETTTALVTTVAPDTTVSDLKNGDSPFLYHFGQAVYDTLRPYTLRVKNLTGTDIVVCLFDKQRFVRSFFVQDDFSAEVSQLPAKALSVRYYSGHNFDLALKNTQSQVFGSFMKHRNFYKSVKAESPNDMAELILGPGLNLGFEKTGETEFFSKQAHDKKN